jgi:hypothetical protein
MSTTIKFIVVHDGKEKTAELGEGESIVVSQCINGRDKKVRITNRNGLPIESPASTDYLSLYL